MVDTRVECHWSHGCKNFKRAGVRTNGILGVNFCRNRGLCMEKSAADSSAGQTPAMMCAHHQSARVPPRTRCPNHRWGGLHTLCRPEVARLAISKEKRSDCLKSVASNSREIWHWTSRVPLPCSLAPMVARGAWLQGREEHRTVAKQPCTNGC